MEFVARTLEETCIFAGQIVVHLRTMPWIADRAVVLGLSGPLGAGKTSLVQCIAKLLGVSDVVTSSSFVLRSDYTTTDTVFKNLIHIDAYRFEHADEITTAGWDAVLAGAHTLVVVEWADIVTDRIPADVFSVTITVRGDDRVFVTNKPLAGHS